MSFLRNYLKFVELNEAHENYHVWSCIAALSAIVGRRVWIKRAYEIVYPSLYVVLVGPPGNRKTAAKNLAQDLLRDIGGVVFSSEATTREALIGQMEQNETTFMIKDELRSFLGMFICVTELKEFIAVDPVRMINFLTAVYDQNFFDYSTKGSGTNILLNPCLSMLACETQEWISDRLKDKIVSGGFSRRVVYVLEMDHKRIIVDELPKELVLARKECVRLGKEIQGVAGEFEWDPAAKKKYDEWYLTFKPPEGGSLKHYYESKHTLLLKVGMLIARSESPKLILKWEHIEIADQFLARVEKNMSKVFAGGGRNELEVVAVKVNDYLLQFGGPILERQLGAVLWRDCRNDVEREQVLKHLSEQGVVRRYRLNEKNWVCATEHLPSQIKAALDAQASSGQSKPPAEQKGSGEAASTGQPPVSGTTPGKKFDPRQEFLQSVLEASAGRTAPPQSGPAE